MTATFTDREIADSGQDIEVTFVELTATGTGFVASTDPKQNLPSVVQVPAVGGALNGPQITGLPNGQYSFVSDVTFIMPNSTLATAYVSVHTQPGAGLGPLNGAGAVQFICRSNGGQANADVGTIIRSCIETDRGTC